MLQLFDLLYLSTQMRNSATSNAARVNVAVSLIPEAEMEGNKQDSSLW